MIVALGGEWRTSFRVGDAVRVLHNGRVYKVASVSGADVRVGAAGIARGEPSVARPAAR
jgi:hypothetical protein